jgi:hypothetical protein
MSADEPGYPNIACTNTLSMLLRASRFWTEGEDQAEIEKYGTQVSEI